MSRDANEGPMNDKMGNDQYCLRWNSYETNILTTFATLLDSEALSDVTLFCEGQTFKAHRLVLAACSTHFNKLFSNSPHGPLIVILDGTRQQDLEILLQFMYKGVAYLHQDRIESVLRTAEVLQVKGLSDGGVETPSNSRNNGLVGGLLPGRSWSPPMPGEESRMPVKTKPQGPPEVPEHGAMEHRTQCGSPRPSGRIAIPTDPGGTGGNMGPPPIFTGQNYQGRHPLTNMAPIPSIYQNFGFTRSGADTSTGSGIKPTSNSALNFPTGNGKPELPSPGSRSDTSPYSSKYEPIRGERGGDDMYESGSAARKPANFEQQIKTSPKRENSIEAARDRSPPSSIRAQTTSEFNDHHSPRPKPVPSDSTTGGVSDKVSGTSSPPTSTRMYDTEDPERVGSGRSMHDHIKTEISSSPIGESRRRSFSGDFNRESLSRLSSQSTPSSLRPEGLPPGMAAGMAAQDLRTSEHEERMQREKNMENFEALRKFQQATQGFSRDNPMATIQKLEMFNQARESSFLGSGGFNIPITAPLSIPASDLARIAETVPDPAAVEGVPTSGTGTKLKCPFCERTYGYETNLRAHIRQRHQGIRVPCPFCHRSFTRNNTVRRHIAREHRHQINPKMIPTKFGVTKVMPDAPFGQDPMMNIDDRQSQP